MSRVLRTATRGQARVIQAFMGHDDLWPDDPVTTRPNTPPARPVTSPGTGPRTGSSEPSKLGRRHRGSLPRSSGSKRSGKLLLKGILGVYVGCSTLWHRLVMRLMPYAVVIRPTRSRAGSMPTTSTMLGRTSSTPRNGSSTTPDDDVPTLAWHWRAGAWHPPSCPTACLACHETPEIRATTVAPSGRDLLS